MRIHASGRRSSSSRPQRRRCCSSKLPPSPSHRRSHTPLRHHRAHAQQRGISSSALPYKRTPPSWVKTASADVDEMITKAAKKGQMPSQIGVLLRDQHGIPLIKSVTGSKILRILKSHGLVPEIPKDLYLQRRPQSNASWDM